MPDINQFAEEFGKEIKTFKERLLEEQKGLASKEQFEELKSVINNIETQIKHADKKSYAEKKKFAGQDVARYWKCDVLARKEKKSIEDVAQEIYGKAAPDFVKSLTAGGNAGANLIEEQYYSDIMPLLYNELSVIKLGAKIIPMPSGNMNIKKQVTGSSYGYVGESKSRKASKPTYANLKLSGKKGTVKVVFSNDLLRSASPAADQMVRDDMVMQARLGMDYYSYYGTGGENAPLGIKNSAGINKVSGTPNLDGDSLYKLMVQPLKEKNIPMESLGWTISPSAFTVLYNEVFPNGNYKYRDELKNGRFHGYPFIETNQMQTVGTKTDIFFGDFAFFFIGEQIDMEVTISDEATYLDEDGEKQSAFDNDETIVKLLTIHDFAPIYGGAFSYGQFETSF